jgi:hypothetical protein
VNKRWMGQLLQRYFDWALNQFIVVPVRLLARERWLKWSPTTRGWLCLNAFVMEVE